MKKRHHVTLLELLIAMGLTSLILMALTFFYQQVVIIGSEADRVRDEGFYWRYMESRLMSILPRVVSKPEKKTDKDDFLFFSIENDGLGLPGSSGLVFTFDNGVCFDKIFSNNVIGRLMLDSGGDLLLFYWPMPTRLEGKSELPVKKEILLRGVSSLRFEFFVAPLKEKEQPAEGPTPLTWYSNSWQQEFSVLPIMVKMVVSLAKTQEQHTFMFPLAQNKSHIIYGGD